MKYSTIAVAAIGALAVQATPIKRDVYTPTDTDILQYALTLEHLENNFYSTALKNMDTQAFVDAGFPTWVRNRFEQIATHEASHVAVLSDALGTDATQPCEYSFPYTDAKSFTALSQVIENVGVSAYLGAAGFIMDKTYLTVAGSILTTEARHQAWIASAVNKQNPWSGPYDTPLGLSDVYSIAAAFITSCPSSNPTLPVKAFPALTLSCDAAGSTAILNYTGASSSDTLILYSGLTILALPVTDMIVTIPPSLQGIAYAVVSSTSNTTMVDDSNIIAGPAIIDLPFASSASNPNFTGM
ncbi:hypothetical protein C368_02234 [Cryptococcus neoformans 125.91]|nr:hypothetical protein C368_02234 [Cryptococcus neoformans var. grubii 125.91]